MALSSRARIQHFYAERYRATQSVGHSGRSWRGIPEYVPSRSQQWQHQIRPSIGATHRGWPKSSSLRSIPVRWQDRATLLSQLCCDEETSASMRASPLAKQVVQKVVRFTQVIEKLGARRIPDGTVSMYARRWTEDVAIKWLLSASMSRLANSNGSRASLDLCNWRRNSTSDQCLNRDATRRPARIVSKSGSLSVLETCTLRVVCPGRTQHQSGIPQMAFVPIG